MTKTRNSKRALILSALALVICISMLVGSTFAWFTDSVVSGNNKIVSGNLDIELEYYNGSAWKTVNNATDLFTGELWEPGHTEVVYLKLSNLGSLALKYQLGINIASETPGINVAGDAFKLSDYIYMGVIEDVNGETGAYTLDDAGRQAAIADVTDAAIISTGYAASGSMLADAEDLYLAVVVYMPTTVGNEANYKTGTTAPEIDLGINLIATQFTYEEDDFGKDYDEDATYPANIQISTPVADADDDGLVDSDINITYTDDASSISNVSAVVPAGTKLEAGATELVLKIEEQEAANPNVTISSTQTATTYEITLEGVDATNTEAITVTLVIEKGLSGVELYHNNTKIDSTYDVATGELTFETTGFSPFTVVHSPKGVTVATAEELVAAVANGGVIKMANDITLAKTLVITKTTVLDGNGYTLTYTGVGSSARAINVNGANGVAIQNLTIKADSAERAINIIQNATNVTIDNVTATAANYTVNVASSAPNAVVTIKDSTLTGLCTVNVTAAGAAIAVNGSTINCVDNNTTVGESYAALSLNADAVAGKIIATDSTINVTEGSDSYKGRNAAEDGVVTINGSDDEVLVIVAAITYGTSPYYYTFASVAAAVEFAKNGDTITLIRDVELNETVVIPAGKTITLNLNGKTLTAPSNEICAVKNEGTLIVEGEGTIIGSYSALYSNGNLTVNGGTFTATAGFGLLVDNIYGTENSVAVINGGTFTGVGVYNPTVVTINGGTFNIGRDPDGAIKDVTLFVSPTFVGVPNNATVTLEGGTFNGDIYVYDDGITETIFVNNGATINGTIRDNA